MLELKIYNNLGPDLQNMINKIEANRRRKKMKEMYETLKLRIKNEHLPNSNKNPL